MATDLEFPPCEQINPSLCAADRFKNQCPSVCGGGGGGGGSSNGNQGNPQNGDNANHKGNDKLFGGKKTTTSKPVPTTTEDNSDNNDNSNNNQDTTTTTRKSGNNPTTSTKSSSGDSGKASTKGSSGSSNCNKIDPCVDVATANAGFLERCKAKGIKETCLDKCRYDVTFDELKKAMLGGKCPIAGMRDFLKCGANGNDNRACCEKTGVLEGKRDFCFPFCNPDGDTWPAQKEAMKYLPCASQMAQIMKCHWAGIES